MRYEILDEQGKVINTILADQAFVDAHHPGRHRLVVEAPPPVPVKQITGAAVIDALTDAELADLLSKVKVNANAELAYTRLQRMGATAVDDAKLNTTLNRFVTAGILTAQRKNEILA